MGPRQGFMKRIALILVAAATVGLSAPAIAYAQSVSDVLNQVLQAQRRANDDHGRGAPSRGGDDRGRRNDDHRGGNDDRGRGGNDDRSRGGDDRASSQGRGRPTGPYQQ